MKGICIAACAAGLAVGLPANLALAQSPAGTAFTYQGQLKQVGVPVNDTCDFEFSLWDDPIEGEPVGSMDSFLGVGVVNGLFTVQLDFGNAAFIGDARWLEVTVTCPTGADPVTLIPRQPVLPAPYALYALGGAGGGGGYWAANGNHIFSTNSGRVGVGTSSPNFTLEVYDSGGSNAPPATLGVHFVRPSLPQSFHDWFYFAVGGSALNADSATKLVRESGTELRFQTRDEINSGVPSTQMVLDADGRLGIGTSRPKEKLHVNGDYYGRGHVFLHAYQGDGASGTAYLQARDDSGTSNIDLQLRTKRGNTIKDVMTLTSEGNVGIGTTGPASRLDVREFGSESLVSMTQFGTGPGVNITLTSQSNGNRALVVQNASSSVPALEVIGTTRTDVLEIAGADVAEKFPVSEEVKPGMVVAIDRDHPGMLCLARGAYNSRVAGVVSGAGDLPTGAVLGNLPGSEDAPPIALSGRVWVYCDATDQPIKPGDLLTTSDSPGHAMKAGDAARAHGAVLGKAMTPLDKGQGLVLVLVSLQ